MKKIMKKKWFQRGFAVMLVLIITMATVLLSSQQTKAASMTWGAADDWQFNPDYNHNETPVVDSAGRSPSSSYDLYYNLVGGNSYDQVNHTSFQGSGNASEDGNNKNARGYAIVLRDDDDGSWVYVGNSRNDWRATDDSDAWNGMYVTREVVQVNDNQSALIKMVIHNTNSYDKTASIATSTDLEVGGDDNAYLKKLTVNIAGTTERAGFTTTNQYMIGVAENKKISLNYYFRFNSYIDEAMKGVSCDTVNVWYGSYAQRWQNLWNDIGEEVKEVNTTTPHEGIHGAIDEDKRPLIDTGFSASWQGVKVPAGGTATVAYVLTAGNSADNKLIRYDANGGSGTMSADTKAYLDTYTIRDNEFTPPTGKMFAGWSNVPDGNTVYNSGNIMTITENMTLYAVWVNADQFVNYFGNGADNKTDYYQSYSTVSENKFNTLDFKKTGHTTDGNWVYKDQYLRTQGSYTGDGTAVMPKQSGLTSIRTKCGDRKDSVDINGASTANGVNAQIWECYNSDAQLFGFQYVKTENGIPYWTIRNGKSGKVLDVAERSISNGGNAGANVQQWEYNGGDNQLWTLKMAEDGYFYICSKLGNCNTLDSSSLVLDLWGSQTDNGTNISISEYHGGDNQQWYLWDNTINLPQTGQTVIIR